MTRHTNGSSRSGSSQPFMQSQPPLSQQNSSPPWQHRDAPRHSSLSSSQLTDNYTDTQMEQDMETILDEVTTACRSRANGSSSADGDSADLERPTKRK